MGVKKSVLEQSWDDKDGPPSRKVTAVIVGCGQRGQNYAAFALDFPSRMEVVGVAEPVSHRRKMMEKLYNIPEDRSVKDWRELTQGDKLADAVIICTQDKDHKVVKEGRILMKLILIIFPRSLRSILQSLDTTSWLRNPCLYPRRTAGKLPQLVRRMECSWQCAMSSGTSPLL